VHAGRGECRAGAPVPGVAEAIMNSQGQPDELAGLKAAVVRIERERQEHNDM